MTTPGISLRKRVALLFFGTTLAFLILIGRLGYIQFVQGAELRTKALDQRTWEVPVEPKRGKILDRKGRELAISINVDSVFVNPLEVPADRQQEVAAALASVLEMEERDVLKRITRRSAYEWVKRKVSDEQGQAVRELGLPGVYLTQESQRVYPKGRLAGNLLGFAGVDSQGLEGIEVRYDEYLRGTPGKIVMEFDARNQRIPQATQRYIPPDDGLDLRLTLDETIQYFAERELEKAVLAAGAKEGRILVMDPKTGGLLALAQYPSFDPNEWQDYAPERWRNTAISGSYSPGSVFKPITASAALEEGKVTPSTPFYDKGSFKVPGHLISNWNGAGLGATDFAEGFEKSANTIFAQVGTMVGLEDFYKYLEAFNLTEPTGVDLPGEASGIRPPYPCPDEGEEAAACTEATVLDLAVMAFGQTLTVTPIQMITAISAIANNGVLMRPHVGDALLDEEGNVVKDLEPSPVRQVISEATAQTVRDLMGRVVEQGTGYRAQVQGYRVGGKTGTTQKVEGGRIVQGKYISSFIGFVPLEDPQLVVYVMIDEPKGIYYGGYVAAPVFAAVARDALHYLGVPPTVSPEEEAERAALRPDDEILFPGEEPVSIAGSEAGRQESDGEAAPPAPPREQLPDVRGVAHEEAHRLLTAEGFEVLWYGSGNEVLRQVPGAGAWWPQGRTILLFGEAPAGGNVELPDLTGLTLREAAEAMAALGVKVEARGSGVVTRQAPRPGTLLPSGSTVELQFAPPPGMEILPGGQSR